MQCDAVPLVGTYLRFVGTDCIEPHCRTLPTPPLVHVQLVMMRYALSLLAVSQRLSHVAELTTARKSKIMQVKPAV